MGRFFDSEGPIMSFLTRAADIMLLNILTCICCLPVITAGAAFTALHYMSLKLVRGEETYIIKGYFKSFKQNFKQATIIWLLIVLVAAIFVGDYVIIQYTQLEIPKLVTIVLIALGIIFLLAVVYIFPVLAKFDNTVFNTIKNAALISFISLPRAILMLVFYVIPVAVSLFAPAFLPVVFLFGFSLPAYLAAMLYSSVLKRFEPQEEKKHADSWVVPDTVGLVNQEEKNDEQ